MKRPKKKAKKAAAEGQQAAPAAKIIQLDKYPSWRDEEDLIDYEPEEPARFSPADMDISAEEDDSPAHGDGPEDKAPISDDFSAYSAEAADRVGGKRSQNIFRRGGASPQVHQERRRRKPRTRR